MPTRLIRQGINDSDRVNQLDWAGEVFYRRLLNVVDDHGLYDARVSKLRADLYPICLNRVREADVQRWIAACVRAGLIRLYEADGKPYLQVLDTRWQVRSEPKYPVPDKHLQTTENSCAQPFTKTETKLKTYSNAQTKEDSPVTSTGPPVPPVMNFPVTGRGPKEWPLSQEKVDEYRESYPAVDIVQECRAARQWCIDNPAKRKTFGGMPAFLTRWLNRAQNAAGHSGNGATTPRGGTGSRGGIGSIIARNQGQAAIEYPEPKPLTLD